MPCGRKWQTLHSRRNFFVQFANENGFHVNERERWYTVSISDIKRKKGAEGVFEYHNGSLQQALIDLFPEIRFDPQKFITDNPQRRFFDELAHKKGFDPLVVQKWKNISLIDVLQQEGGCQVLQQHGGSPVQALIHLYPELNFGSK